MYLAITRRVHLKDDIARLHEHPYVWDQIASSHQEEDRLRQGGLEVQGDAGMLVDIKLIVGVSEGASTWQRGNNWFLFFWINKCEEIRAWFPWAGTKSYS